MKSFALLPAEERALYWRSYSNRTGVPEFIVEKDFWVCWLLGHIFAAPKLGAECVFKGGTSLSKVFGAIDRFSEDIDLGLTPASLGWQESDLDDAPSNSQRQKRNKQLQADCAVAVETQFMPELEAVVAAALGAHTKTDRWLSFDLDAVPPGGCARRLHSAPRQDGVRIADGPAPHRHALDHALCRRAGARRV